MNFDEFWQDDRHKIYQYMHALWAHGLAILAPKSETRSHKRHKDEITMSHSKHNVAHANSKGNALEGWRRLEVKELSQKQSEGLVAAAD